MSDTKPKSGKTQITMTEYYQLVGLTELAKRYDEKLRDIERAAAEIVDEIAFNESGYGHVSDMIYGGYDADELLKKLGLEILPGDNT